MKYPPISFSSHIIFKKYDIELLFQIITNFTFLSTNFIKQQTIFCSKAKFNGRLYSKLQFKKTAKAGIKLFPAFDGLVYCYNLLCFLLRGYHVATIFFTWIYIHFSAKR